MPFRLIKSVGLVVLALGLITTIPVVNKATPTQAHATETAEPDDPIRSVIISGVRADSRHHPSNRSYLSREFHINSFSAPDKPSGMDFDSQNNQILMVSEQAGVLYIIDADTGLVLGIVPLPGFGDVDPGSYGIAIANDFWWHSDYQRGILYKLNPANGAVLEEMPMYSGCLGIAWDGNNLWGVVPGGIGDVGGRKLYRIDPDTGNIVDTVLLPHIAAPIGLTWDGSTLWVSERDDAHIHQINTEGRVLTTKPAPSDKITGIAAHNPNMWVGSVTERMIWRLDFGLSTVVSESRLDIGMPYNTNRGCSSPFVGCGGPFHGFHAGVCTDLVIDAYQYGVPFDLAAELQADYQTNPHGYWYGSARNAHDMHWYFERTNQLVSHDENYEPGDIAFFRWGSGNWHAGVTSQINTEGRPTTMVHAPGCGLSCAAFEQDWNNYYDTWSQDHGRLNSQIAKTHLEIGTLQTLVLSVDAPATMRLYDAHGNVASTDFNEDLVASNIEAYIPYIPGSRYEMVDSRTLITVTQPLSNTADYLAQITGVSTGDFHLRVQTLQDNNVTASKTFTESITVGETKGIALTLSSSNEVITFSTSSLAVVPVVTVIPSNVELTGHINSRATVTVTISETNGQQPLNDISVSVSDVVKQTGEGMPGTLFALSPPNFNLPANGSQTVQIEVDLADIQPGLYQGGLNIASVVDGSNQSIPLSLTVEPLRTFLPLTLKGTP